MGPEFAGTALAHWGTLTDNPEQVRDGVQQVLGRPPRPFAEWARDHAHEFTPRTPPGRGRATRTR